MIFSSSPSLPVVKICGQTNSASIDCAAAYGVRFVGFVFHQGSPRSISPERVAMIPSVNIKRVGVFVRQQADEILHIMKLARLDYAQLHGRQGIAVARAIGAERVIRVLWPEQENDLAMLQRQIDAWTPHCSYFLLDAGSCVSSGGLGRQLDVSSLSRLRFTRPWILAGGLNAENITRILQQCSPNGVDFNSGIESSPGMKSPVKILSSLAAISQACRAGAEAR